MKELSHIYWLGGSPCAGKTSIADALAQTYGFQIYHCDIAFFRHEKIVTPEKQPVLYKLAHLTSEQLWIERPVKQQIAEEIALYCEEFPLILADLLSLSTSRPVLVEGAALLPACVKSLLMNPQQALWIVPTREFQLHHYAQRAWAKNIVQDCSDPEQAFRNWMERDIGFASFVAQEASTLELDVLIVDGNRTLSENIESVRKRFCR